MNTKLARVFEEKEEIKAKNAKISGIYKRIARLIASKEFSLTEIASQVGVKESKIRKRLMEDVDFTRYVNQLEMDHWNDFKQVRAKRMKAIVEAGLEEVERRMTDPTLVGEEKLADINKTVYNTLDAMRQDLLPATNVNDIGGEMSKMSPINILQIIMSQTKKEPMKIVELEDE